MPVPREWTEEEDSYIRAHYNTDLSANRIAQYLKVPRGTVISRYHVLMGNRVGNKYFPTGEPQSTFWRKYK